MRDGSQVNAFRPERVESPMRRFLTREAGYGLALAALLFGVLWAAAASARTAWNLQFRRTEALAMRLYLAILRGPAGVQRAFARVNDQDRIASCVVEPAQRRMRFLAPESLGDELMQRIYEQGDLVWCSRHVLDLPPEADAG